MVTTPRKGKRLRPRVPARPLVYLQERMKEAGRDDQWLADRLGVRRETVTRYRSYPNRLNPSKLHQIASALECSVLDLLRPVSRESLDQMLEGKPPELQAKAIRIIRELISE